MIQGNCFLI